MGPAQFMEILSIWIYVFPVPESGFFLPAADQIFWMEN